jgi:hypothetical protein
VSCAIKGDQLAIWQVNPFVDPGGTSRLDVLVGSDAQAEAVTFSMTKGTCLSARAKAEEHGGSVGA